MLDAVATAVSVPDDRPTVIVVAPNVTASPLGREIGSLVGAGAVTVNVVPVTEPVSVEPTVTPSLPRNCLAAAEIA